MVRSFGSTRSGGGFDAATILGVWNRARIAPGRDPGRFRLDACGAVIEFASYGVTNRFGTGWEIDHIYPVAHGGTDALDNLQALQWENNRAKSDGPLVCAVVARAA
jgi:hypothetical protein